MAISLAGPFEPSRTAGSEAIISFTGNDRTPKSPTPSRMIPRHIGGILGYVIDSENTSKFYLFISKFGDQYGGACCWVISLNQLQDYCFSSDIISQRNRIGNLTFVDLILCLHPMPYQLEHHKLCPNIVEYIVLGPYRHITRQYLILYPMH